ncbi:MAG TPA: MarR family winged helix-turn-helix transcriptional regulator [Demequina sp.]|nr:MarR family winged helix-turn-helix transcriptional regulator [Demequina sp.]
MSATPSIDVTLFRALHLATRQVTAGVEQQLQEAAGVSLPEFQILNALFMAPEHRARPREIGEILGWEKSRTSHQVTRMQKRGLLERFECTADMRGTWVVLTPAGVRAALAADPAYVASIERQLGSLAPAQDRESLARQLLDIGRDARAVTCQGEVAVLESSLER